MDLLSQNIEQQANYELQNSTYSETLNNENHFIIYDFFEPFEVLEFTSFSSCEGLFFLGTFYSSFVRNDISELTMDLPLDEYLQ